MLMKTNISFRLLLILTIVFICTNKPFSQVLKHSKLSYTQTDQNIIGKSIRYNDDKVYFTAIKDSFNFQHTVLFCYDTKQSKLIWSKNISLKDNFVSPVNIQITSDGNILLGAYDYAWNQQISGTNILFLLFEPDGTLKWKKHVGGLDNEQLRDFILDKDDNICFAADYYGQSQYLCVFGKLDKDCNLIVHNSVKKNTYNYPYSIVQLNSGKYLISGSTAIPNEAHRGFITLTDNDMNILKSVELYTPGLQNSINKLYPGSDNSIYAFCEYSAIAYCFKFNDTLKLLDQFEISYGDISSIFEKDKELMILNSKANWLGKLIVQGYQTLGYYPVNGSLWSIDFDKNDNMVYGVGYMNINNSQKSVLAILEHSLDYTSNCAFLPYYSSGGKATNLQFTPFEFTNVPLTFITKNADEIFLKSDNTYSINPECQSFANSIEETVNDNFSIFPNPAFDHISLQNTVKNDIEIIDIYGRTIVKLTLSENATDISFLKPGFYILRSGTQTVRLIKM